MKQAQEAFSKVDTKAMTNKLHQAVQFMKKKMQDFKKSTENNEIAIKVNNKDAQKQISQIQKQIDSLQKKINARQMKLNLITPRLDEITAKTTKEVTPDGVSSDNPAIQQTIDNSLSRNKEYNTLIAQEEKITQEITMYNQQLNEAKAKMAQLGQQTSQTATTQNKLSSFFGVFRQKIEQVKSSINNMKSSFSQMPKLTQNITNNIKGMGTNLKQGLGHILKYAGALFSLRSIYSALSNSASSWLSSQNAGAQQLSANINYMKYAMGSVLAPVIQFVTNLVYQLMKAIQSVVYTLLRVNIFANASAKSYSSMAGSAKKAKEETKQLAGIHDEINNIQNNDNSNSGSGSGGGATPSFDLSGIDSQLSPLAQKLYDFFKPLKESWDKYGYMVIEAVKNAINGILASASAMWSSIEQIITNGTVYSIIANILNSIGAIGQAWANAWRNDNNGTEIVQGVANIINDLTGAILNLVSSTGFQSFLNGIISAFSGIVQFLEPVISGFIQMSEILLEIVMSTIGSLLETIGNALQFIGQNETATTVLKAIGEAIAIVVAGIIAWNVAQLILNGLMGLFAILTSPITLIILGIVAAITAIILVIQNWGAILEWLGNVWNAIVDFIVEIITKWIEFQQAKFEFLKNIVITVFNAIKDFIVNVWNGIVNTISNVWNNITSNIRNAVSNIKNGIVQNFQNAYNSIQNIFSNIGSFFSGVWSRVRNTFSSLGTSIGNAISNSVKSGINGVISMIQNTINRAINLINGAIRLINKLPGVNVGTISTLYLPRLAKGGVLTEATAVVAGEYSGAKTNPEIVTPQNIMYDTMRRALSDSDISNNDDRPIYLTVKVGNTILGQILLDDLRNMKRRSGKDIEALVGG